MGRKKEAGEGEGGDENEDGGNTAEKEWAEVKKLAVGGHDMRVGMETLGCGRMRGSGCAGDYQWG